MTKNHERKWAFRPGGPETQLHDILWAVHDEKTVVEARARKISGEFPITVGGRGRAMRVSLIRTHVCVRRWAITKPERRVGL